MVVGVTIMTFDSMPRLVFRFKIFRKRGLLMNGKANEMTGWKENLTIFIFNGSGGSKNNKDLRTGVALSTRATFMGHIDAIRELGHCLQDGYGAKQNIAEGHRFFVQANARKLAAVLATVAPSALNSGSWLIWNPLLHHQHVAVTRCPLLSDFRCNVPAPESHSVNPFLSDWFLGCDGNPAPGL
ncbi:F-box protein [Forsythia ovata]|uniref:F-box protein n=1 Tax=Forsythia ovata TaxID=205694 RepID=A0ABD1RL97_9LAMI